MAFQSALQTYSMGITVGDLNPIQLVRKSQKPFPIISSQPERLGNLVIMLKSFIDLSERYESLKRGSKSVQHDIKSARSLKTIISLLDGQIYSYYRVTHTSIGYLAGGLWPLESRDRQESNEN
jgi:hypothetical protein